VMQREAGMTIQTELPNPYIPIIGNLSKSFVVTQSLHQVILPFPSELDTSYAHELHLDVVPFANSSQRSGVQTNVYNLDPTAQFTRAMFGDHYLLLGAAISGKIHSAIPDTDRYALADRGRRTEGEERIVVVGNGDFVQDAFLSNPENLSIFLNTVDYLTDDLGLVSIRSKSFLPPPLEPVSEAARTATKDLLVIFPPLLVLAIGLSYWRRTVKRRKSYRDSLVQKANVSNEQDN
jgi:gliding motility-associatede transport system auxiliary component